MLSRFPAAPTEGISEGANWSAEGLGWFHVTFVLSSLTFGCALTLPVDINPSKTHHELYQTKHSCQIRDDIDRLRDGQHVVVGDTDFKIARLFCSLAKHICLQISFEIDWIIVKYGILI